MKKASQIALIFTTTILFSHHSYAGDYFSNKGVSINIASHHHGFSLSYKAPIKYPIYKQYKRNLHALKAKQRYKHKYNNAHQHHKSYKHGNKLRYSKPYHDKISHHYYDYRTKHVQKRKQGYKRYERQYKRSCHPVSKTVKNRYGRYQDIGGTMCYNRSGHAYIVPGSRYHIR